MSSVGVLTQSRTRSTASSTACASASGVADSSRAELIFTKDQLLAPLQKGMLQPPHPMADGMEERDYFLGKVTEATPAQQEWVETYGVDDPAAAGAPAAKHRTAPGAGVTRGKGVDR